MDRYIALPSLRAARNLVTKSGQPQPEGYSGATDYEKLMDREDLDAVLRDGSITGTLTARRAMIAGEPNFSSITTAPNTPHTSKALSRVPLISAAGTITIP